MAYISSFGDNYVEKYKEFGDKIIAENKEILKKAGVKPAVFNQETKTNPMEGLAIEHQDEISSDEQKDDNNSKNLYTPDAIKKNETLMNVKASNGVLNSMYKKGMKASAIDSDNVSEDAIDSLEEADGTDSNDNLAEFMETDFKQGNHFNAGGYTYYENGKKSSTESATGNITGSFKNKNGKLTLLYGGSFEFSNTKQKSDEEDTYGGENGINKNGNALLMGKYKNGKMTYAGGASAYIYDNNTQLYNIYAGTAMYDFAVTLNRVIQVSSDDEGKKVINNKTNVKFNVLKPKKAGDFPDNTPELPTPSSMQQYDSLVESEKEEVDEVVNRQETLTGLRADLEISTANNADEYGIVLKHTSLLTKKDDKNKTITLTPYLGVYDYHPDSQEGLKIRTGAQLNLDVTTNNQINFKSKAIIDNKRIMRNGSSPQNTFMAVVDSTVSKKNIEATVSAGYINSSTDTKYSFITGSIAYNMKNSSLSLAAGYQSSNVASDDDKIFHAGLRYAVNF